jgi:hypothetical protein
MVDVLLVVRGIISGRVLSGLVVVSVTLALVVLPPTPSKATSCFVSDATTPQLVTVGSDKYVMSEAWATCDPAAYKTLEISVRRVRTGWPDAVVAVQRQTATTTDWYVKAQGCELSASGSSHRYKGVRKFTGYSDDHSDIVWLTCINT